MTDTKLRDSVLRELKWEPQVDTAHIGVSAHNGAVTLAGHVSSYPGKADRDGPRARARHADVILFVGRRRRLGRMNVGT